MAVGSLSLGTSGGSTAAGAAGAATVAGGGPSWETVAGCGVLLPADDGALGVGVVGSLATGAGFAAMIGGKVVAGNRQIGRHPGVIAAVDLPKVMVAVDHLVCHRGGLLMLGRRGRMWAGRLPLRSGAGGAVKSLRPVPGGVANAGRMRLYRGLTDREYGG